LVKVPFRLGFGGHDDDRSNVAAELAQRSTADALVKLGGEGLLAGRAIESVALTTGATAVQHKLGRVPRGWFVTDIDAAATVRRTAWSTKTLTLVASASCTVNLWVY
jgi:hypothetical protein